VSGDGTRLLGLLGHNVGGLSRRRIAEPFEWKMKFVVEEKRENGCVDLMNLKRENVLK
jgi:hypothetical protein